MNDGMQCDKILVQNQSNKIRSRFVALSKAYINIYISFFKSTYNH